MECPKQPVKVLYIWVCKVFPWSSPSEHPNLLHMVTGGQVIRVGCPRYPGTMCTGEQLVEVPLKAPSSSQSGAPLMNVMLFKIKAMQSVLHARHVFWTFSHVINDSKSWMWAVDCCSPGLHWFPVVTSSPQKTVIIFTYQEWTLFQGNPSHSFPARLSPWFVADAPVPPYVLASVVSFYLTV